MIFTSYTYIVFLFAAFLIHWSIPVAWRKPFLIAASYLFYASWKWPFCFLLLAVSLFNWSYARWVLKRFTGGWALACGVIANVLVLIYFKYTGFLIGNVAAVVNQLGGSWHPDVQSIVQHMGMEWNSQTLQVLPVLGVSFFTFQGVAYLVDVATGDEPMEKLSDFLLFKALWPQLIAGPIIRIGEIRDQILTPRVLDYGDAAEGARRVLMGLFKKVVLADFCLAATVEMVFPGGGKVASPHFIDCGVGVIAFGMQIYFDFSAYSDMAIGSARMFGFRFPENFNWPYMARSPQDFWNRWHMTLSRWIRDYLFTPMYFAARGRTYLAPLWLLLAMAICGLWHGAAWTLVLWGVWHGLLLAMNASVLGNLFPQAAPGSGTGSSDKVRWRVWVGWVITFGAVSLGWIFFRATSLAQALDTFKGLFTFRGGLRPAVIRENNVLIVACVFVGLLIAQLIHARLDRMTADGRQAAWWRSVTTIAKPVVYCGLILAAIVFDKGSTAFVYFQF